MGIGTRKYKPDRDGASPLARLNTQLEADMKAVNALILKHLDSPVEFIPQVGGHLIAAGGKRIRPLLTLAATAIYDGDMARAHRLAAAVEFIHSATLLHDDVVDESDKRRGKDTANHVFGNQVSVLVGDFLFSRAFQLMVADGSLEVLKILSDAAAIIAQGEVLQLTTAGNLESTMDDYHEVIRGKTAALFAAACEVGPVISGADQNAAAAMAEYGMNLGIAFQITDDALDYSGGNKKLGKAAGDDFREGKITAPVILALEKAGAEERRFWRRCLQEREIKEGDFETAQTLLKKHEAMTGALKMAEEYAGKAKLALAEAPDHDLRARLDEIADYIISRSY